MLELKATDWYIILHDKLRNRINISTEQKVLAQTAKKIFAIYVNDFADRVHRNSPHVYQHTEITTYRAN